MYNQRYQIISQDQIEMIHENSMKIMENIGVVIHYERAKEVLKAHGCTVEGDIVKFPRKLVEDAIKLAPSEFTIYARNPEKNVLMSTETTSYAGPNCPPFVTDLDRGRRTGSKEDFCNLITICDALEHIDMHSQIPCEMNDVPVERRAYEMLYNTIRLSEKPFMGSSMGYEQAKKVIEMASIAFGGMDVIKEKPVMYCIPCTLTPLSYDDTQIGAIFAYAEARQPQLINSLAIAGMTAPATLVGLVSVSNAEVLAGITLAQCISPGTPVIYSGAGSNAEMRTGSLSIGSPEHAICSLLFGQLCKYYQIPCRISGAMSDSCAMDTQAAYESGITLTMGQMAGGNFILHGVGIIEGYNCVSYEKMIIDNEMIGFLKRIDKGVEVNEDTLAYDVIEEVGPQGVFLIEEHTLDHFRDEFYRPTLSQRVPFEEFKTGGCVTAEQRANKKWKEILANYNGSTLDNGIDAELRKYMENLF
ncbi:MAG: trimethylamine methyltransferase family protein [Lachnospiraceae bacterium]|nr:trimethylamine methyltransferase family protein [Lachnospiraceae bacterium]